MSKQGNQAGLLLSNGQRAKRAVQVGHVGLKGLGLFFGNFCTLLCTLEILLDQYDLSASLFIFSFGILKLVLKF